jgi:hypothetical protein
MVCVPVDSCRMLTTYVTFFAQLIRPPQFQGTLEASHLVFGSYRPAPEDPVPASAPVFDTQAEDATLHQFEAQDAAVDDDDFGIPPPPPMPPRSHDHEAGSSMLPLLPLRLLTLLLLRFSSLSLSSRLTWQPSRPGYARGCSRCFRPYRTGRILFSSSFFRIGLRAGHSWLLCYRILVSRFPRFSLHHLLRFRLLLCQRSVRTPSSFCWSFFLSAPTGHPGFHVTGSHLRLPSAASATSFCCHHYCCGSVCDHFSSGSFYIAASIRVSTSSSFYSRSWI